MTFLSKLSELFERVGDSESRLRGLREEESRVAAAALLVNASVIDGEVAPEERRKLKALLRERFDLSDDECRRLIRDAEAREREAVDVNGFTSVLSAWLDQDGRKRTIEMLWEMAMADGVVHEFESNLVCQAGAAPDQNLTRRAYAPGPQDQRLRVSSVRSGQPTSVLVLFLCGGWRSRGNRPGSCRMMLIAALGVLGRHHRRRWCSQGAEARARPHL